MYATTYLLTGTTLLQPGEGPYMKAKLAMRKAYGFKSLESLQIAFYHSLGKLPEPPNGSRRFC